MLVLLSQLPALKVPLCAAPGTLPAPVDRRTALQHAGVLAASAWVPKAFAISATTMTGKSKPELGIILVDEVKQEGKTGITGNVVLADGLVASVNFNSPWPIAEGGYYDVEVKSRDGDTAFVQVAKVPAGKSLVTVPKSFFVNSILGVEGRYGAYGAPTDVKVLTDDAAGATRRLEVAFTALSPGAAEVQRRAFVTATQPAGSTEAVMLVAGTAAPRWKKGGKEEAQRAVDSFAVTTRPTTLKQEPASDFRFGKTSGPGSMKSRNDGF